MTENQKPRRPSKKQIQSLIKKEGKIRTAFILRNKHEMTVKDIAESLEISERTARAYQWRVKEPEKYKALLKRYFDKKKAKAQKKQKKEKEAEEILTNNMLVWIMSFSRFKFFSMKHTVPLLKFELSPVYTITH